MAAGEHPMAMVQHPMAIPWRYVAIPWLAVRILWLPLRIPWLSHGGGWFDAGSIAGGLAERESFSFRFGSAASKSLYKTSAYELRVTDY